MGKTLSNTYVTCKDDIAAASRESGEYLCMIDRVSGKKSQRKVSFNILELRKSVHDVIPPSVFLIAAPIKKQRMKIMVEKATELNAHTIIPLITQNVNNSVDISTLQRSIVQATEQGERLVPPLLANAAHIKDFFDEDGYLILKTATDKYILNYLVCSARSDLISHYVEPLHRAVSTICTDRSSTDSFLAASPLAVIIGPEGGFTSSEMQLFEGKKNVKFVSLGQNVLRSETAALAALAVIQMLSR